MSFLKDRRVVIGGIVAVLLALGVWFSGAGQGEGMTWVEAQIGDMVVEVDVEGTVVSTDSSMLTPPQTARRVFDFQIAFMAPEGEEVSAGTPVLSFDSSELERQLRDRQTGADTAQKNIERLDRNLEQQRLGLELQLAQAEANLRQARLQVEVPEDLSSARELEKARLDLQLAEIQVELVKLEMDAAERSGAARRAVMVGNKTEAEMNVAEIEQTMEQMTIRAPRSGTVIYVADRQGQKKKVGDSAWRGEDIIELPDLNSLVANGEVDEPNAGRVEVGQPFRIRLDAHPEVEYTGTVASISRAVTRKSFSRGAPLKVIRLQLHFDEVDRMRMRPGMRFRGRIETDSLPGTLMIPQRSVFPSQEGPVVYKQTLIGYEAVAVTLGRRNDTMVEVVDGLEPGDLVAEHHPEGG